MYLQCEKQKKAISSPPIQCERDWKGFFHPFLNSPISTMLDIVEPPNAIRFSELHPARWRLNPMNIIAGIQNGLEDTEGMNQGRFNSESWERFSWKKQSIIRPTALYV